MRPGIIKKDDYVLLKKVRAEAYGRSVGPYRVLYTYADKDGYKKEWVALDGIDDFNSNGSTFGPGVVSNRDVQRVVEKSE